jgi:hypothetical protein
VQVVCEACEPACEQFTVLIHGEHVRGFGVYVTCLGSGMLGDRGCYMCMQMYYFFVHRRLSRRSSRLILCPLPAGGESVVLPGEPSPCSWIPQHHAPSMFMDHTPRCPVCVHGLHNSVPHPCSSITQHAASNQPGCSSPWGCIRRKRSLTWDLRAGCVFCDAMSCRTYEN